MLNDSSILVTGGTGSFGNEFVARTLDKYRPQRIVIYSRDEMKQWDMAHKFQHDPRVQFIIGDVVIKTVSLELSMAFIMVHAAATKISPQPNITRLRCKLIFQVL